MVLYVPATGSKTRFFCRLTWYVLREWRREWLRVFPNLVFLPVLMHMRDIYVRIRFSILYVSLFMINY